MDRNLLQRYTGRDEAAPDDADAVDNLGCYGRLRGVRERSVMLELRKKNGNRLAVGYSWIERMEFDPSEGILLVAGPLRIQVRGRNLNSEVGATARLFEALTCHRVTWVQEASRTQPLEMDGSCVVEELAW